MERDRERRGSTMRTRGSRGARRKRKGNYLLAYCLSKIREGGEESPRRAQKGQSWAVEN